MALAGFKCTIRRSGSTTATTAEAMTAGSEALSFQITSNSKRVIDPAVNLHFRDGAGTTIAYTNIATLNFVFGTVIFTASAASHASITFNGSYLPLMDGTGAVVPDGVSFSQTISADLLDTTVFGDSVRRRIKGLEDVDISLDLISTPSAASQLQNYMENGTSVVLDIDYDGSTASAINSFRAHGKIESIETSGSVDGLIEMSISFKASATLNSLSGKSAGWAYGAN